MKICILTHNLLEDNGGGVLANALISGLKKELNAEVTALTTLASNKPFEHPLIAPNIFGLLRNAFKIRKFLKEADVIHALDAYPYGIIGSLFSLGLKKKIIITAVGSGSIQGLHKPLLAPLLRYAYRRASPVVAISNFTKEEINKKIPALTIEVINPAVNEFFLKLIIGEAATVRARGYKPYILSVGSLRWRKGYKKTIEAFKKISAEFPDLSYVIIGKKYSDGQYEILQEFIKSHGLENRVHLITDIDDRETLSAFYKNAELFVLMSQSSNFDIEGFGMVFLEAAAFGLPVIGSRNSGVEDAVKDGVNGILLGETDIEGCALALRKILKDPMFRKEMSEASLKWVSEFTPEKKIGEYVKIYKSLNM